MSSVFPLAAAFSTPLRRNTDGTAPVPPLPAQLVQLALERPIIQRIRQTGAQGILDHVIPFLVLALMAAQLRIPEMPLPYRVLVRPGPVLGGTRFPETHPFEERLGMQARWSTKKVNMVRHDHITAD